MKIQFLAEARLELLETVSSYEAEQVGLGQC